MQRFVVMIMMALILGASLSGIGANAGTHTAGYDHGHHHGKAEAHSSSDTSGPSLAPKSTFHGEQEDHGIDHLLHHMDFCLSAWRHVQPSAQSVRHEAAEAIQHGTVVPPEISPPRAFSV
ncbi:hypothetical protein ACSHT0_16325 [Tepidicaulis sp. LMO-SS28]|uniref:hypothetical protein n=1 Tax=Tepidicaulis sp. LMO-SS28 TaxID=3447455 RepID=UPI003EE0AA9A